MLKTSSVQLFFIVFFLIGFRHSPCIAQTGPAATDERANANILLAKVDDKCRQLTQKVIDWRRDFHQHPELSNREFRTARIVAEALKSLGIEVQTGVAKTGVVGLLKG